MATQCRGKKENNEGERNDMNRRGFLAGIAKASLAGVAAVALLGNVRSDALGDTPPVNLQPNMDRLGFKGGPDGRIWRSLDGGATWQPVANFGKDIAILEIFRDQDQLCARAGFRGHTFLLRSRDGQVWRATQDLASL